ncbi:hypothetical protein [Acinetobacter pittii]|uniref:hypothetical protein n=1 Tax=Acinetobacter pittii TaxID=48296 RepID=UPI002A06AE27|nr:hypothetical protein [Acinetobacter pittii]MDX8254691.1 hypothetical protein [Acinetobacter pittii]
MAANINAEVDLNPLLQRIVESSGGLIFCSAVILILVFVIAIYFIAKSGVINSIREHQEYKVKRANDEIKYQEELLKDDSFKNISIKYNII